jgi:hypothetical protein
MAWAFLLLTSRISFLFGELSWLRANCYIVRIKGIAQNSARVSPHRERRWVVMRYLKGLALVLFARMSIAAC